MDFRPPPMVLGKPDDDDDDESLTCRWWQAVEAGEAAEVQQLLETRPELIDSRRRVLEMATASARRVAALEVPPLMVVCDNGHSEVLRALLEAGAGACQPVALSLPSDSGYEPVEDDFATWLAPLCPLDRAMERGHAGAIEVLLRWYSGKWESLSTRLAKQILRSSSAGGGAVPAAMYASMFAGSRSAAAAVLSIMMEGPMSPTPEQLSLPLAIAISRGAAGVAQALLDAGADVEAAAPWHENLQASELCGRPLCVAARSLNNPACSAVLLRAGAVQHHPRPTDQGIPNHFAAEEAEMALYKFERHRMQGLLNVPERAAELARATADVLATARRGTPLLWSPDAHSRFPAAFRREAKLLLLCLYAGARRARAEAHQQGNGHEGLADRELKESPSEQNDQGNEALLLVPSARAASEGASEGDSGSDEARCCVELFGVLPDASLRQRVVAEVVGHLSRTMVWGCLPCEFWDDSNYAYLPSMR